jgi:hypothetical protein
MRHRRTATRLVAALALMAACAACGSGTGASESAAGEPSASASTSPPSGTSAPASSSASSAPPGSSTSALPTSGGATPTRLCLSGTVTVLYPPADNPLRSTCVQVGTRIRITLKPPANHTWAPVTSSDREVVTVLDNEVIPDGTRTATARAAAPGAATLDSADTYTPDPHGPPSKQWQLTLTIVP